MLALEHSLKPKVVEIYAVIAWYKKKKKKLGCFVMLWASVTLWMTYNTTIQNEVE